MHIGVAGIPHAASLLRKERSSVRRAGRRCKGRTAQTVAEQLKNHFGPPVVRKIASMIETTHKSFDSRAFLREALDGYEELDLTPRAWHIMRALRKHLPREYPDAIRILLASIGPPLDTTEQFGMAPFLYLPHVFFVAECGAGAEHFEESMRAQLELTQRFSAEYSIRVFLDRYQEKTLQRLQEWATHPSPHVRRLVSEGTRPRLPWAPRLRAFQENPAPVVALLELLKDDPELYVRRSVANNLNDIGKDNPLVLVQVARRWLVNGPAERRWLVQHALRSLIKKGDAAALDILGFGAAGSFAIGKVAITPRRARIGGSVVIDFELRNTAKRKQRFLVDYRVHFVKASGRTSAKVFKLSEVALAPGERIGLSSKVSLRQMTTRKHFKGRHKVEVVVNGSVRVLGDFDLR